MKTSADDALKPLADVDGAAVFDEPWQAEALALADTLVQNGAFTASQWSQKLGQRLEAAQRREADDNQQTYYQCVLEALEALIDEHAGIDRAAMAGRRADWEAAYRRTPHGQPVRLEPDGEQR
ncbi:MAG: nitrile hydratase accessory protein [Proteobacteria bacterium]|nr:nitrile hydratase accessory protein [Pseudomonadota bacterium]